jgi:hypothetical protein
MRIIKYIPKQAQARTQYREIPEDDLQWLQSQMIQWLAIMGEMDAEHSEDSKWVLTQWWHRRTDKVHRGQHGANTPCSVISGIIRNTMYKDPIQRDLTDKQMSDIEYISAIMAQVYADCQAVRFQIGFEQ